MNPGFPIQLKNLHFLRSHMRSVRMSFHRMIRRIPSYPKSPCIPHGSLIQNFIIQTEWMNWGWMGHVFVCLVLCSCIKVDMFYRFYKLRLTLITKFFPSSLLVCSFSLYTSLLIILDGQCDSLGFKNVTVMSRAFSRYGIVIPPFDCVRCSVVLLIPFS